LTLDRKKILYLALDRYPISPTVRGDFQMSVVLRFADNWGCGGMRGELIFFILAASGEMFCFFIEVTHFLRPLLDQGCRMIATLLNRVVCLLFAPRG